MGKKSLTQLKIYKIAVYRPFSPSAFLNSYWVLHGNMIDTGVPLAQKNVLCLLGLQLRELMVNFL